MNKKINLGVVFGGRSKEHEVSLSSAMGVIRALDKDKYNIVPIAITKKGNWLIGEKGGKYIESNSKYAGKEDAISLEESGKLVGQDDNEMALAKRVSEEDSDRIDLILPILHGPFGEDGKIQGMMEMMRVPYVFSGVLAHALGMNKERAKIIAKDAGVPVVDSVLLIKDQGRVDASRVMELMAFPLIVKPNELGSSVGVAVAKNEEELEMALHEAFRLGDEVMVEAYVKGREFTVTVMEKEGKAVALPSIEIIPVISEFYDYKAKYEDGGSKHVCPAQISDRLDGELKDYAVGIFEALGCCDLARVDFVFDDKKEKPYFIDINTIPGMTPTSLAPESAKEAGMEFGVFLDELIKNALGRAGEKKR